MAKNKIAQQNINLLDKIKYILSNPNYFFEQVKNEYGIKNSLITYISVSLFSVVVAISIDFTMSRNVSYFWLFYAIVVVLSFVFSFAYAGIMHLLAISLKGSGTYSDAYRAYAYSMLPFLVLLLIPFVGSISIIYSLILMMIGISKLYSLSKGNSAIVVLVPIIFILGLIVLTIIYLFWGVRRSSF